MLAVHFDKPGGPENLYIKEVPKPSPGEGEVLLKVAASALNRGDLLQVSVMGKSNKNCFNQELTRSQARRI